MPHKDPQARREYNQKWLARRRAEFMNDKFCVRCGSTEDLQIDHIDPSQKIDHRIWSWSAERRTAELAKCQVLCGNCHKAKTRADREPPHGTHSRYSHRKCRCEECKKAHAEWNARLRSSVGTSVPLKRERPPVRPRA